MLVGVTVPERSQVPTQPLAVATVDVFDMNPDAQPAEGYLVVHVGGVPHLVLLPDGVEVTIGRSRSATIFVDDERVSRRHARIQRRGHDVYVADLGSRNGTLVNARKVTAETRVQAGDVVEAGPARAVVAIATRVSGGRTDRDGIPKPPPAMTGAPSKAGRRTERADVQIVADAGMLAVYERCRLVAGTPLSVLITGETGVGKEGIAEAIQRSGPRADKPFVRLHVGALPESLVESELFGHERGAFTGADRRHHGYFEAASGGTLLLDEIGELPLPVQAKLLRVLESGQVSRVGSTDQIAVDVRVLAATNRDLAAEVRAGRFREDLFFRLSAFRIEIPPLRQRPSEIPLLAALFARNLVRAAGRAPVVITPAALAALERHGWPGNIRELKHAIEAAVVMAGDEIDVAHLPASVQGGAGAPQVPPSVSLAPAREPTLGASVEQVERDTIVEALKAHGGNQTLAAQTLGVSRRTLIYKMKRLGIRSARVVDY